MQNCVRHGGYLSREVSPMSYSYIYAERSPNHTKAKKLRDHVEMEQPKLVGLLLLMYTVTGINGLKCNGMEGLCDLKIDQVTFPGAHNAGSDKNVAGSCLWRNQASNMSQQFGSGIRYFDIDTCWHKGKVKNCHCNKGLGCHRGTDMSTTLNSLDFWMKYSFSSNGVTFFDFRNEVIILHFNSNADISGEAAKEEIGKSLSQMLTNLWDPNGNGELKMNNYYKNNNQWPTLRQAIESKQRVFVFMENGPAKYITPQPDWLLQSNGFIESTWTKIHVSSTHGCTNLVPTADKCDSDKSFVELAAFGTHGLCTWDMAWHCSKDNGIGKAINECNTNRQTHNKIVNFLIVDFAVDNYKTSVVERARTLNQQNIQTFLQ